MLIVPQLDDGRLVVVRQFRYPNGAVFTEFPAGKLDPGEAALATAKRELQEETGYTATTWTHLGRIHAVVSYSTETIELYVAQGLVSVGAKLDHGEFLEIATLRYDQIVAAADRGEITDAKTIATLYHLERRRQPDATWTRRLIVSGRVQGVGFRDGADRRGAQGWRQRLGSQPSRRKRRGAAAGRPALGRQGDRLVASRSARRPCHRPSK